MMTKHVSMEWRVLIILCHAFDVEKGATFIFKKAIFEVLRFLNLWPARAAWRYEMMKTRLDRWNGVF
jgi:hypothetical protein